MSSTAYENSDRPSIMTDPVSRKTHLFYCVLGNANSAANQ